MRRAEAEVRPIIQREPEATRRNRVVLITGGAGFIGSNLADRLLSSGERVLLLDNLSRPGVERNLRWLRQRHGDHVEAEIADVRNVEAVRRAVRRASRVYHFAAQVAVTTSLADPVDDFLTNARGTLNVLEAIRGMSDAPPLLYTSTNKVYGGLDDIRLTRRAGRYEPRDATLCATGISERRVLDFHSPYGCSKGTADQYVIDYARSFGLRTVVFRMSCIYGPQQYGNEDQGWVAHFLIQALRGEAITLYGDGMQVRDVLYVDDLVNALVLAHEQIDRLSGQAFNIGGGPGNTTSLLELVNLIATLAGRRPRVEHEEWRTGDQRYYVSDTRRFQEATGWSPVVDVATGVQRLFAWLDENDIARVTRTRAAPERPLLVLEPVAAEGRSPRARG